MQQPRLLIDAPHFFVYKPKFDYLYNVNYFQPDDSLNQFDGLVRCYMTTLAFSRPELTWKKPFNKEDWEFIDGDDTFTRITLFGHKVQRRNWTWSCDVYARKKVQP